MLFRSGGAAGTLNAGTVTGGAGTARVNFNHTGALTFAPNLTGSVAVTKLAAGTTTLTGANSHTGGTTIEAGTLRAGISGALSGNSAYTVNGGTLDLNGFGLTMSSLSGTGGTVSLGAAGLTVNQAGDTAFAGAITGDQASFVKSGAGELTLTGTSSLTGNVSFSQVQGGTLRLAGGGAFSTQADFSIAENPGNVATVVITGAGSALTLTDFSADAVSMAVGSEGAGTLHVLDGGTFLLDGTVFASGGNVVLGAGFGSSGTVLVSGAGSTFTVLTNPLNTANGMSIGPRSNADFTVADGAVASVNQRTAFATSSSGSVATLNLNGTAGSRGVFATTHLREFTGSGFINFDGGILRPLGDEADFLQAFEAGDVTINAGGAFIDTDGFDIGIGAPLGGPGQLTKQGTGTLTLSGTHSYAGGTTVSNGTLDVGGTLSDPAGTTTITGTATLGGNGTITGPVSVTGSGQIYPATGQIGTLSTGSLTFASGTKLLVDLSSSGTGDKVEVTGNAALGGATLDARGFTTLPAGLAFPILTTTGTVSGTFAGLPNNATFTANGALLRITYGTNAVTLSTAIADLNRAQADGPFDLFAATGQAPGSGAFSGPGVSGGAFNPASAGPGVHTITFTPNTGSPVTFTITVTATPSLVVTTTADVVDDTDGQTSLREAISHAATLSGPQTITFSDGTGGTVNFHDGTARTITLDGAQLEVVSHVTITGPGADRLTISGDDRSRILNNDTASLTASGLTLANGNGNNHSAGAIYSSKPLKLTDCRLTANQVSRTLNGCALSQWRAPLELTRCTFSQNGGNAVGGAIFAVTAAFEITDCVFAENVTTHGGGAICFTSDSTGTIRGTTFSDNESGQSGGALLLQDPFVRLQNCTFTGNHAATEGGGAIYAFGFVAVSEVSVTNCTIADNSSIAGGGIYLRNIGRPVTLSLANTILSGNIGGSLEQRPDTTLLSLGHNLSSDGASGLLTATGDLVNTDPLLGPLQDNGGPTPTMALLPGSPAIDAGDPDFDPDAFDPALNTDQRGAGFPRVVKAVAAIGGARIDIGAFEVQQAVAPEIAVFNGVGTAPGDERADNTGTAAFDDQTVNTTSTARTFTIQNTGTDVLALGTLALAGDGAAHFTLTQPADAELQPAETVTFTVAFAPLSDGVKKARVEIPSNDAGTALFRIPLSGTGVVGGPATAPVDVAVSGRFMLPAQGLAGGGRLYRPLSGVINDAGRVALRVMGQTGTGGITSGSDSLLLSDASGSMTVVAREGAVVRVSPWQTLTGGFAGLLLTDAGRVVFQDKIRGAPAASDMGYFSSPDGLALELDSREGDAAPGGGTFITHTGAPAADAQGRVYFRGQVSGLPAALDTGVWMRHGGALTRLFAEGQDAASLTGDPAWAGQMGAFLAAGGDGAAFALDLQNNPAVKTQRTDAACNAAVISVDSAANAALDRKSVV